MRRSARIQEKHDEQNVATNDENGRNNGQRKTRNSRSSLEKLKPLREIPLNVAVLKNSCPNKVAEVSKVTRSGKHFSPYYIVCDSNGVRTVKTKWPKKTDKEIRRKKKENMGKTEKRKVLRDDLEENKENLIGRPLEQLLELQKQDAVVNVKRKPNESERRPSKEQSVQTEKPADGRNRQITNRGKSPGDLPPFSVKNFPGPFFPLDEALQFDEEAIKNSLTREEEVKIQRALKKREDIVPEKRLTDVLKSDAILNDSDNYGVFKPAFKDIRAQMIASDAMAGHSGAHERPPGKLDIMEEKTSKHPESRRFYRKKITDTELMAWHRYNVATSTRYAPVEADPGVVPRYYTTRRTSPTTDLVWKLNKRRRVPTVDEFFKAEAKLTKTKKVSPVQGPSSGARNGTRDSGVGVATGGDSSEVGGDSLVFDPEEFTSSTPVAKK